jgi:hypothetical protein
VVCPSLKVSRSTMTAWQGSEACALVPSLSNSSPRGFAAVGGRSSLVNTVLLRRLFWALVTA